MCHTGQCKYENHLDGECELDLGKPYPKDAACEMINEEMRALTKRKPIPGYCDGCEKIHGGFCSAYFDVCKHTGADRGGFKGCAFSPMETTETIAKRVRVGQQKQRGKK